MTIRSWLALIAVVVATSCRAGSDRTTSPPTVTTVARPSLAGKPVDGAECGTRPAPPPAYQHVVWIFMENHRYDEVIDNTAAPFETALAHRCGTATRYASVASPSLPNYVGATSGDTHGIADDGGPAAHPLTADNLFRQVRSSGRQAHSYQEAMPGSCALDSKGNYAVKHNPAAYYTGVDDRTACKHDDLALGTPTSGSLADALDHDTLGAFSFITPDLCNDTHNCDVATGDRWLQTWLPRLVASSAYRSGTTAIFVAWDEYTPMPSIVVSPSTPAGSVTDVAVDHYSLLRTTEELLGITDLLGHAARAPSMRPAFGL
ncbi:MAG: alkaline phosphatase family protein [Actinomycetota bacterium]|nr:alkaline phosphatase family protein [Actinomycetota bacterium]